MTKIYITKYALTKGILAVDADLDQDDWAKRSTSLWGSFDFSPKEYRLTEEEAIKEAERQRTKRIRQLQNQIRRTRIKKIQIIDDGTPRKTTWA